jgi:hypothetical protein
MASPAGPLPRTGPSPLDAFQSALAHTRRDLFPFRFERWVTLGFLAFLDQCGRRAGLGFNLPTLGDGGGGGGGDGAGGLEWLAAHALIVAAVAAGALTVLVVVAAVVLWVNSRGVFMYVDAVATGRAEVGRPWAEHASRASSYFAWSFGLAMAILVLVLLALAAGAVVGIAVARAEGTWWLGIGVLVLLVFGLLAVLVAASLVALGLRDFVAPLQLATGLSAGGALRTLGALVRAQAGAFALYLLLKLVFSAVLALAMLLAACLTCCCALLPLVSQTLFQPAFHLERGWSLYLLRQMGYDVLGAFAVPAPAAAGSLPAPLEGAT